ncbi:MAG TPA: WecB/TagA/CpsF family glycosyltransferase [Gemmatimonadaceae bacterium]|nr:WecB/TagA/CpsF family glycosyltransferase [Gemmatimonadaceae bacterium]
MSPADSGADPHVLGTRVDATSYADATAQVMDWAKNAESRYVCCANVHVVMEAYDSPAFRSQVNAADLVTPDGMPLVWALRRQGHPNQTRVYGPDLMMSVIESAARENVAVGLLGGKLEVLEELVSRLVSQFPALDISYRFSPPFRALNASEDNRIVEDIKKSGARILFVGLGCPRQEMWMAEHAGKVQAVMLGVGAAFDFHAGAVKQAPSWMQRTGLEWAYRLSQEPTRLWRRYLYHNPRFLVARWTGSNPKSGSQRHL